MIILSEIIDRTKLKTKLLNSLFDYPKLYSYLGIINTTSDIHEYKKGMLRNVHEHSRSWERSLTFADIR